VDALLAYTLSQWSDGVGEGGFLVHVPAGHVVAVPSDRPEDAEVTQLDDGKAVPPPSRVAREAWAGRIEELRAALAAAELVDGLRGGYTGLHLAILRGHVEAALHLAENGADVNRAGPNGERPLHLVALSNALSDDDSARLTAVLRDRGANVETIDARGQAPAYYAGLRNKTKMREVLERKTE
jgi:hypothetical protein